MNPICKSRGFVILICKSGGFVISICKSEGFVIMIYHYMILSLIGLREVCQPMKEGPALYRCGSQVLLQHIRNLVELLPRPQQVLSLFDLIQFKRPLSRSGYFEKSAMSGARKFKHQPDHSAQFLIERTGIKAKSLALACPS